MSLPAPVAAKLSKLIPRLASEHDPEIVSTVRAIVRVLAADKLDLHDLARALEAGGSRLNPGSRPAPKPASRPAHTAHTQPGRDAQDAAPPPKPRKAPPQRPMTEAWNAARRSAQHAWIQFILASDGLDAFDRPLLEQINAWLQRGQMFDLKRGDQNRLDRVLERFPFDTDV